MRSIFLYFLVSLFLFSCSSIKKIGIEVLMAPEFSVPETSENLVILNNSPIFSVDSIPNEIMKSLSDSEIFIIDTIVTTNLFDGFFAVVDESNAVNLKKAEYIEIRNLKSKSIPGALAVSEVIDFCINHEADALITLEYFDLELDFYDENIFDFSIGYAVRANLSLKREALWRIYSNTGYLLNEKYQNDTLYWSNADYYKNDAYNGLPLATDAIRSAFFAAGQDYGKMISPFWLEVSRVYYKIRGPGGTDSSLDKDYLLTLSEHRSKLKSYKACFNLALISEKEDNLRNAVRWLEIAEIKNPGSPYAGKYKRAIQERIAINEKLN